MSDNEEFITMFIDEAKLAAQLTHHNICQIFDLGKIDNSYYIAMEFVEGKDLRAVLKSARAKSRPMPVELAILICSKILSALDYAHRKKDSSGQPLNLVHRDVSPQNILISYEGDVKLVDFGIAKAATKMHVTQHGALKGKLLYMSPEQAWGKSVDRRSDIFSAGAVLYEMLTGRPLFFDVEDTEVTILEKVREAHVTPIRQLLPDVPPELEKIIAKALQKDPEARYNMASDIQKDLDNLFYNEGYNANSASLANFARSLFPEEWGGQESSRETIVLDKQAAKALKSSLESKPAEPPAHAISSKPAAAPPPKPAAATVEAKQPSKKTEPPSPVVPPQASPEPVKEVQKEETAAPVASGFREISMPEIMPPQQTKSHASKFILGAIALAVIGTIAFLFFNPKQQQKISQNPPKQNQANAEPQQTPPAVNAPEQNSVVAPPVTVDPKQDAAGNQKEELLKRIDEEQKKAALLKGEEQKKLELQKLEEQKKLNEQRKLEEQKAEEARLKQQEEEAAKKQAEADAAKKKEEEAARLAEEEKAAELARQQEEQRQQEEAAAQQQVQETVTEEPAAPAEPVVQEGDLVELGPDVVKPVLTNKVDPAYPPVARGKKIEGTVILQLLVSEGGDVSDVRVLRAAGGTSGLNEAAMAAVRQWQFRPAVKAGKRVKVWITYPIVFKLQ
jgi:TonB family protein